MPANNQITWQTEFWKLFSLQEASFDSTWDIRRCNEKFSARPRRDKKNFGPMHTGKLLSSLFIISLELSVFKVVSLVMCIVKSLKIQKHILAKKIYPVKVKLFSFRFHMSQKQMILSSYSLPYHKKIMFFENACAKHTFLCF